MAGVVQIEIRINQDGTAKGLGQTEESLERLGKRGNETFRTMESGIQKARDGTQLLSRTLGVEVPRSLQKVIANSKLAQNALGAAFNVLVVAAFAQAIATVLVDAIIKVQTEMNRFADTLAAMEERNAKIGNKLYLESLERLKAATLATAQALATDEKKIRLQLESDVKEIQRRLQEAGYAGATNAAKKLVEERTALEKKAAVEIQRVREAHAAEARKIAGEVSLLGVSELETIQRRAEIERAEISLRRDISRTEKDILLTLSKQREEKQTAILFEEVEREAMAARMNAAATTATGIRQIEAQLAADLDRIREEGEKKGIILTSKRVAAEQRASFQIAEIIRNAEKQTVAIEDQAALAGMDSQVRAYATISLEARRKMAEVEEAFRRTEITAGQAARETAAIWIEASSRMRDQMASDLENVFDAITEGRIGQMFLQKFKKLIFQMVASWIMGTRQMQAGTAGGGGLLGGILGALGIGGGGFGGAGATVGGIQLPPGVTPTFPSSGLFGGGGIGAGALSGGINLGSLTGMPLSAGGGGGSLGGILPAGGVAVGAGMGGGFARLMKGGGLFSLAGLGLMTGAGKVGFGSPARGAISGAMMGAGGVALAIGALMGPLSGVAGSMTALGALAGPWGLAIVGIAALIGGLFGLGGRKKKQKQRDAIEAEAFRQISIIEDAYKFHQMDYLSARESLEQLRQQVDQQMRSLGWSSRMNPHIDAAIQRINGIEGDRQTRAAMQFGPAQFGGGGYVGGPSMERAAVKGIVGGSFAGGGAVAAYVHRGEYVLQRRAVERIGRPALDAMNAGGGIGGGGGAPSITINAIDAKSFRQFLADGGVEEIVRAFYRARSEGIQ